MTERMEHVRSVAVGYWVGIGARDERDALAGASHFLEHLLFKGTGDRSAAEIAESIDEVGGDLNAFTTKEYTAFEVRLLAEHLELGLDVLSDIFWSPAFRPGEVETERDVILEEIMFAEDEPADFVHDLLTEAMFPDDPLGRSILGTESSIRAMGRDAIASFHADHYRPGNVVVAAAGALDHDRMVEAIHARDASVRGVADVRRHPPAVSEGSRHHHDRDTEQAHVALGVSGVERTSDDRYALELLVHVLGGGLSSRLFQEVRERRGLAYNVFASRSAYEGAGIVSLYAGTAVDNVGEVLDVFRGQLDDLSAHGITERELVVAKGSMRASIYLGLEDSTARMARLARSQIVHGRVPDIDEVVASFDAVSCDDIARVAGRLFGTEPSLVVLGPRVS